MSLSTATSAHQCLACSLDGVRRLATDCRESEGLVIHLCHDHAIELDAERKFEAPIESEKA